MYNWLENEWSKLKSYSITYIVWDNVFVVVEDKVESVFGGASTQLHHILHQVTLAFNFWSSFFLLNNVIALERSSIKTTNITIV